MHTMQFACASSQCHFIRSHKIIRRVYGCLPLTCHLHFWQNGRDLLRATALTQGWNGYRKSQHRKLTLERKILPPLLSGFEPETFRSGIRHSNHRAIPAPKVLLGVPASHENRSTLASSLHVRPDAISKHKPRSASPLLISLPSSRDSCGAEPTKRSYVLRKRFISDGYVSVCLKYNVKQYL